MKTKTALKLPSFLLTLAILTALTLPLFPRGLTAQAGAPAARLPALASAPLRADDEHFIADSGGNLDTTKFRSDLPPDGKYKFNIPVTRYYFTPGDANIQFDAQGFLTPAAALYAVNTGFLPSTARLTLRAFDVDQADPVCPEVDYIYINGTQLTQNGSPARLSGANGLWSEVSFDVPVALLKFPQSKGPTDTAPTSVQNEIAIEIEAVPCSPNGRYWTVYIDYGILTIQGAVRPVLFAHGLAGSSADFNTLAARLKADGIPTASSPNLGSGLNPLPATAQTLGSAIERTAKEFGVDRLNLFAHSTGGLFARQAVMASWYAEKVESILTFDSPNHGSAWAGSPALTGYLCSEVKYPTNTTQAAACQQAVKEFTLDHVRQNFNYANCQFNLLTGWNGCTLKFDDDPSPIHYRAFAAVGSPYISPKTFTAYPWDASPAPYPTWELAQVTLDGRYAASHSGILSLTEAYECAAHLLDPTRYACPTSNRPPASGGAVSPEISAVQPVTVQSGSLAGAGSAGAGFSVNGGSQLVVQAYTTLDATFSLLEPGGRVIDPTLAGTEASIDFQSGQDFGANLATYIIANPKPGAWQATVASTAPANKYAVAAYLDSPTELRISTYLGTFQPGETITAEAALVQSGAAQTGGTFSGEFEQPDGTYLPVTFNDSGLGGDAAAGDGIFTAQFAAPADPDEQGNYRLQVSAQNGAVQRQNSRLLAVSAPSATLGGVVYEDTLDDDNDGYWDWLALEVEFSTTQSGHFDLHGTLVTPGGARIESTVYPSRRESTSPLPAGTHTAFLRFSGAAIYAAGQGGQFTLTGLQLYDTTGQAVLVDSAINLYTTSDYPLSQFEHDPYAAQSTGHTVADADNDGMYENLTFQLATSYYPFDPTALPEPYVLTGRLVDPDGDEVAWASQEFTPTVEAVTPVNLIFAGEDIVYSFRDGPYTLVDVSMYKKNNQGFTVTFGELGTSDSYYWKDFENRFMPTFLPVVLK
jgi:pimeloyl-ACP methyl ester carboxylesterase